MPQAFLRQLAIMLQLILQLRKLLDDLFAFSLRVGV